MQQQQQQQMAAQQQQVQGQQDQQGQVQAQDQQAQMQDQQMQQQDENSNVADFYDSLPPQTQAQIKQLPADKQQSTIMSLMQSGIKQTMKGGGGQ